MSVTALVPARDEQERIAATVRALRSFAERVIVVDDRSSDATASMATEAGAEVVASPRRLGKGGALERGLALLDSPAARAEEGGSRPRDEPELVLFADADLGDTAAELRQLVDTVLGGAADLAIATLPRQGGGFGTVKRFAAWAIRRLGGLEVTEALSGQRAMNLRALSSVRPLARGFGVETAMTIDAARAGLKVVEVPLDLTHRATGRDLVGFAHRGRQGWDILGAVVARSLRRRP